MIKKYKNLSMEAHKISRRYGKMFKIMINSSHKSRVLRQLRFRLNKFNEKGAKFKKTVIATPNPEIMLMLESDILLYTILASTDVLLIDGIGLAQAVKFMQLKAPKNLLFRAPVIFIQGLMVGMATIINRRWLLGNLEVIHGSDFMFDLIKLANRKRWRVVLLGGADNVAEKSVEKLRANFKKVKMYGFNGPIINKERGKPVSRLEIKKETDLLRKINKIKPHLLFIGFGAPKQEKWVDRMSSKLNAGAIMVVGGTFDYLAGKVPHPPGIVKALEFEWFWRLFTQKGRVKRVFNAVVLFPLKIFLLKLLG